MAYENLQISTSAILYIPIALPFLPLNFAVQLWSLVLSYSAQYLGSTVCTIQFMCGWLVCVMCTLPFSVFTATYVHCCLACECTATSIHTFISVYTAVYLASSLCHFQLFNNVQEKWEGLGDKLFDINVWVGERFERDFNITFNKTWALLVWAVQYSVTKSVHCSLRFAYHRVSEGRTSI